jgi:hypothetical protein
MTYVVEPLLEAKDSKIALGLAEHIYKRWGGVIRMAPGQAGAGSIVAHLRDVAPSGEMSQALGQVLQMTNVAAAASVLNIGVSAVGFAIMAKKLNRLQGDMNRVLGMLKDSHQEVLAHLSEVEARLVELRLIGLESRGLVREAIAAIGDVRKDLLDGYMARMLAELQHLARQEVVSEQQIEASWKVFTEARIWLESGLDRERVRSAETVKLFDLLVRYRAWCFAAAGEIQLARRAGALAPASEVAQAAAVKGREWASTWTAALVPADEYQGVARFGHTQFVEVPLETKNRLSRLQFGEEWTASDVRHIEAAERIARIAPSLPEGWFEKQRALGTVLDFVEETTERVEGIKEETAFCAERRLGYDRWEKLRAPEKHGGLAIIRVGEES